MLKQFGPDIWIADGDIVSVLGFQYPTRCAVIRLGGDALLVWSPVTLTKALKSQIDALGRVTHLIAPNSFHHLFIDQWQSAYPDAQLFGPAGLGRKRKYLSFAGTLDDAPNPSWATYLDQVLIQHRLTQEAVFFHKPSQTVIFTDLIQQFPRGWHKGWRGFIARLDLMEGSVPQVPRKFRYGFGKRKEAQATLRRVLHWPAENILLAHGKPVQGDGRAVLRDAFAWLMR